jgi:dimethylaniline monooxygenase (N-oxide forming)
MLHKAFIDMQDEAFNLKPEWNLENPPPFPHKLPIIGDGFYELLVSDTVTLVTGLKRVHRSHVELIDGEKLEIDVIIFAIGYNKSYSLLGPYDPSRNMPQAWKDAPGSMGRPLPRLYQGIFSLDFPDSLAYSEHVGSTLSASINGDVASMALAQVWLGNSKLPSDSEMANSADKQNEMAIAMANSGEIYDPATVDRLQWNLWADKAAGFGIQDRLGNGWKAWWLRATDHRLYKTLLDGKFLPQVYRLFDEGKRPPWKDARDSFLKANKLK